MADSNKGRIPADKLGNFTTWNLPEVKQGQVVAAEKLADRGPRGELLNVNKDEVVYQTLTAGQLEEIHQQAYADVRHQAYEEGLQQGKEEGYQAGIAAGQQVIQQHAQQLQSTLQKLNNQLEGQDDEVEQALVNLSTCIARSILRRELQLDASHMLAVVQDAIAALPIKEDYLQVFLSPDDHRLLSEIPLPDHWNVCSDAGVSAGGCRVVSKHSVVDYTLEEQFQQTINQLVEQRFAELAKQAHQRQDEAPQAPEGGSLDDA